MNKVINPIYPNENERIYNARIKSRALAGCYEDKNGMAFLALVILAKELKQVDSEMLLVTSH